MATSTTPTPPVPQTPPVTIVAAPSTPASVSTHSSAHVIEVVVGILVFLLIAAIFVVMLWYGGQPKPETTLDEQVQVTQPVAEVPVELTLGGNIYTQVATQDNPINNAPVVHPIRQTPNPFSEPSYKNPFTQ